MPRTGSDFLKEFIEIFDPKSEAQPAREKLITEAFSQNEVPSWIRDTSQWFPVTVSGVIDSKTRKLTYRVSPWLRLGTDSDHLLFPAQPATFQWIADRFRAILPSTKIVRDVFAAATLKIPIQVPAPPRFDIPGPASGGKIHPPSPDMATPEAFGEHDRLVKLAMKGNDPGKVLIGGHSKNVVVFPNMPASKLAIYGGYTGIPGTGVDGLFYQSAPGPHGSAWVDYSQCDFLVHRDALLDGQLVDLADVFRDPKLSALVSSQGPFEPRFPNAGTGGACSSLDSSGVCQVPIPPSKVPIDVEPPKPSFNTPNTVATVGAIGVGFFLLFHVLPALLTVRRVAKVFHPRE